MLSGFSGNQRKCAKTGKSHCERAAEKSLNAATKGTGTRPLPTILATMNYYDEEITISGPDSKHLSSIRSGGAATGGAAMAPAPRQRNMVSSKLQVKNLRGDFNKRF